MTKPRTLVVGLGLGLFTGLLGAYSLSGLIVVVMAIMLVTWPHES